MTQSPGHKQHPDHQVRENSLSDRLTMQLGGETVADSSDVIAVDEDGHPRRYYFSRSDVAMNYFRVSDTRTTCPFKGEATYYHANVGGETFSDAAWSYEEPYDEHRALKGRMAFNVEPAQRGKSIS